MFQRAVGEALGRAERAGSLIAYRPHLDEDEYAERMLWLRPEVSALISGDQLDRAQAHVVEAALHRFVTGGEIIVVTANAPNQAVAFSSDIKELKGSRPIVVERRFRPPKYHLRLFGRFLACDAVVLTSFGVKSRDENTGAKPLSVAEHRQRCSAILTTCGLRSDAGPARIQDCLTNGKFFDGF